MKFIYYDGSVYEGYNIDSVTWNAVGKRYEIAITDVNFIVWDYITVVTPSQSPRIAITGSGGGNLHVYLYDLAYNKVLMDFQFVIYEIP